MRPARAGCRLEVEGRAVPGPGQGRGPPNCGEGGGADVPVRRTGSRAQPAPPTASSSMLPLPKPSVLAAVGTARRVVRCLDPPPDPALRASPMVVLAKRPDQRPALSAREYLPRPGGLALPKNIPEAILAHMQPGRSYSRGTQCEALGLSMSEWNWAIRQLKERAAGCIRRGSGGGRNTRSHGKRPGLP